MIDFRTRACGWSHFHLLIGFGFLAVCDNMILLTEDSFGREGLEFIFTLALLFCSLFWRVSSKTWAAYSTFYGFVLFYFPPLLQDAVEHSCVGRFIHEMDGWLGVGWVKGDGGARWVGSARLLCILYYYRMV